MRKNLHVQSRKIMRENILTNDFHEHSTTTYPPGVFKSRGNLPNKNAS